MKHLITFILLFVGLTVSGQNPIKLRLSATVNDQAVDSVKYNINGVALHKGDYFEMYISGNGNGNSTTRQLLFDFQYDNTALTLISVNHTGTGGNGGILPQNSSPQETYYQYPGYSFRQTTQNTTSDGTTNFSNSTYDYVQDGPSTVVRYNLTWSSTGVMPFNTYSGFIKLKFQVKQTMTGFAMNPVQLNFAGAWNGSGTMDATVMETPTKETIYLNPNADSYVNAKIDINANMTAIAPMKVLFYDTLSHMGYLSDITATGTVNVNQSQLMPNRVYRVMAMLNMDKLNQIQNGAVTVSDFTGPQNEFVRTGLDGTPSNTSMTTGASYLAADMNNDKTFNGGDLPLLLASAVGLDTLLKTPVGYQASSGGYMSIWTFTDSVFNNMTTTSWKDVNLMSGVYFKTGNMGDFLPLNLKYLLWGDVNRSHSSQVVNSNGTITSTAIPSLQTSGIKSNALAANNAVLINTTQDIASIDVNLSNLTVTSNTVSIPVTIDTKNSSVSAVQFQFEYDPTKIKFEELKSNLPNTWYIFANSKEGKVKFGALDKNATATPLKGALTPFTLMFSTIGNGVDILTSVKISQVMDASSSNGTQLGINLNTISIKLTGYNNF